MYIMFRCPDIKPDETCFEFVASDMLEIFMAWLTYLLKTIINIIVVLFCLFLCYYFDIILSVLKNCSIDTLNIIICMYNLHYIQTIRKCPYNMPVPNYENA